MLLGLSTYKRKRDKRSKPSSNIKQPTQQLPDISTPFALLSRQNSIDQSEKQHYATRINTVFAVLHVDDTNGIPSLSPRVLTPVTFMTPSDTGMMIREGSLSSFRLMKPHSLRHKHPEISRAILLHLQTKSPFFMSTRSSFWRCYQ